MHLSRSKMPRTNSRNEWRSNDPNCPPNSILPTHNCHHKYAWNVALAAPEKDTNVSTIVSHRFHFETKEKPKPPYIKDKIWKPHAKMPCLAGKTDPYKVLTMLLPPIQRLQLVYLFYSL